MSRGAAFAVAVVTSLVTSAAVSYGVVRYLTPPPAREQAGPSDVPSIVGLKPEQARQILEPLGLLLILSEEREDPKIDLGAICEQRPLVGSRAPRGAEVQAVVSKGAPRRALVPPLAGGTAEAAAAQLQAAGLRVGATAEQPSDLAKGLVISTTPAAGAVVDPGGAVDLVVSGGVEDVAVPSVVAKGISRARKMIEEAGLLVGATRIDYDEDYGGNVVLRQTPPAGTRAPKGTRVDLVINESDD